MITGCTIAELQAKIAISELNIWLAYRRKYGPMNPVRTYDTGPAIISHLMCHALGNKKTKPGDFMPYFADEYKGGKAPAAGTAAQEIIEAFGAGVIIGKR